MRITQKTVTVLSISALAVVLSACGGQSERAGSVPTEAEAMAAVQNEIGIKDAKLLDVQDVRNEGVEYYGI